MKSHLALACIAASVVISGCDGNPPKILNGTDTAGDALDRQAIAAGILPDPKTLDLAGRFETRSELGTDKFCAVGQGESDLKVGLLAVFGPESKCEGQGSAKINDGKVDIRLEGEGECAFTAEFDGVELRIEGQLGEGCATYCTPRASLSGTSYFMVEQGDQNARRTLGRDIAKLCR